MHIELDLKLTLNGSAQDNETKLALTLANLAHLVAPSTSAQLTFTLSQHSTPAVVPTIMRVTDLPALTVAEPAPAPTAVIAPAPELAEPAPELAEPVPTPPAEPVESTASRLPFDEYDRLVRSEMKRLSRNGIMPGHVTWNDRRDRRLPTLQAVVYRYGFKKPEELANKLGYLAPERIKAAAQ